MMMDLASGHESRSTGSADPAAQVSDEGGELRGWAILAVGSLALAGAFAFLLALSRIPGIERILPWTAGFFAKGLVIHVIFSLVVWFLTVFAFLASLATFEPSGGSPKLASLGPTGRNLVAMSFPFLFVPAFFQESAASLNNYIPVIVHRSYYFGLTLLALGIALPAVRLLANAFAVRFRKMGSFASAMSAGAVIYLVALSCIVIALLHSWGAEPGRTFHEHLFWGGGHVLQFLYALMMLTGWFVLVRGTFGERAFDPDIFLLAIILLAFFTLAGPAFYMVFETFSPLQMEAFRRLQLSVALPALLVAGGSLNAIIAAARRGALPWEDPGFVALVLSPIVFAAGGIMGLLITGSDTRTPAHYHGVIAAVNLALMGVFLKYALPAIGRPARPSGALRAQIVLFGGGQLIACIGLFLAGGYGATRKTPAAYGHLVDGAVVGMYLNGIGALIAVVGGLMFVYTVGRALLQRETAVPHGSEPTAQA